MTAAPFRITSLWAWIATDENGVDGICAHRMDLDDESCMMPLIGADESRIRSLRPYAEELHRRSGQSLRLARFDRMVDLETLGE